MMQFLPHDPVAPFRAAVVPFGGRRVGLVQEVDVVVRGHACELLRRAPGVTGVRMAPPEDRLRPFEQAQATMVAQHRPELCVHPTLDEVVGRRNRTGPRQVGVEVGEQRSR